MKREQATKWIGNTVIVEEDSHGAYIGVLNDVQAEPKKPWVGVVTIKGIERAPHFSTDLTSLKTLKYEKDEQITVQGRKIEPLEVPIRRSFRESYAYAIKDVYTELSKGHQLVETKLHTLEQELRKWQADHVLSEDAYVYYHVVQDGKRFSLYDEAKGEALSLESCPFEFELFVDGQWCSALYSSKNVFELTEGKKVRVKHGEKIRLNKGQFDPYRILLNELEHPSLHALQEGLTSFGLGHEHCVYCHNTLLEQLLSSSKQKEFAGVNFISFKDKDQQILVLHHFKRLLVEDGEDKINDRFEFTSDNGVRSITSYVSEVNKES
ncbi:DUF2777 family protein [Paenalkalicoccus suaedae]|uniref:DUF2777 family protein n=1 Tax=Paenalkalicoccus suaedae TaxID=2592382 RepID=A0A859FDJ4_9BACI|nr:DUF2777 family protein [Paenalkalicoccus suaedae]QKS71147.1 DUF2777 family protein [Paenalkalicoccus suaedae]